MDERKTAAELMAELSSDTGFLQRMNEKEDARRKLRAELADAEAPLVSALRSAGIDVTSVWDLVGREQPYSQAVSVLFEHVKRAYPDRVREGILRALGTPSSRERWGELVDFFEKNSLGLSSGIRHAAAFALSGAADDDVIDDIIRLVSKSELGADRVPLLLALVNSGSAKARMLLSQLRHDPSLGAEIKRLRRIGRKLRVSVTPLPIG